MLLPSSFTALAALLIIAVVCSGSWANLFHLCGRSWRFELFYLDFVVGAVALAFLAACSAGTFGSELSFADRLAVAGLRSQAYTLAGGFVFNIGNMLLLASVSLAGMSVAFPLLFSTALITASVLGFLGWLSAPLRIDTVLCLAAVVAISLAARNRFPKRPGAKQTLPGRTKTLLTGLVGGLLIGSSYALSEEGLWGDLGLGPYAGLLMFSLGMLASTLPFSIYFMNIGIEGGRVPLRAYLQGSKQQHLLGILGGAVWALGGLAALLVAAQSIGPQANTFNIASRMILLATLVAMLWGAFAWGDWKGSPRRNKVLAGLTAGLISVAALLRFGLIAGG